MVERVYDMESGPDMIDLAGKIQTKVYWNNYLVILNLDAEIRASVFWEIAESYLEEEFRYIVVNKEEEIEFMRKIEL